HLGRAVAENPFDRAAARALGQACADTGRRPARQRLAARQRRLRRAAPKLVPAEAWFEPRPPRGDALASILLLCCNPEGYTRQCLDSVLRHTRAPYELILVDNGSTDGTAQYLEQLRQAPGPQRVVVLRNEQNLGFARGNNQALAQAWGDFLVL